MDEEAFYNTIRREDKKIYGRLSIFSNNRRDEKRKGMNLIKKRYDNKLKEKSKMKDVFSEVFELEGNTYEVDRWEKRLRKQSLTYDELPTLLKMKATEEILHDNEFNQETLYRYIELYKKAPQIERKEDDYSLSHYNAAVPDDEYGELRYEILQKWRKVLRFNGLGHIDEVSVATYRDNLK